MRAIRSCLTRFFGVFVYFYKKHTMKVFNANGKCKGRSRGTTNVECRRIASAARGLVEWSSIWIPRCGRTPKSNIEEQLPPSCYSQWTRQGLTGLGLRAVARALRERGTVVGSGSARRRLARGQVRDLHVVGLQTIGRSRDTQMSNVVGLHGPRAVSSNWPLRETLRSPEASTARARARSNCLNHVIGRSRGTQPPTR